MGVKVLRRGAVSVFDYHCDVRPGDKPFPEVHASMSVSYVRHGSFGYRTRGKSYELVGGSVLIGNAGDEFTCTHDYAHGDRCLSFHLAPEVAEEIAGAAFWRSGRIPPLDATTVMGEIAQAAVEARSSVALEEAGLLLAHRAARAVFGTSDDVRVSERSRRCAVQAALWLDNQCEREIALSDAAALCGLSVFHFLRVFTRVAGVTPHQYLMRARLRRAARLLAGSSRAVTQIALDCGFEDLSNFTKAFRRASGRSPAAFRNFYQA
jgi:AraC family transcriptional regulator